jgi:hypothetical protein
MAKAVSPGSQRQVLNAQNSLFEATKHQIEKLNPKEIPVFLSHLSNARDLENFNRNHNLSVLNALVRIQGQNIIPYISPIMSTLIRSLECSHEHSTFALHETCCGLTCEIAQYGTDPLLPEKERIKVVSSLCGPLSDSLMSSQNNVASVCAFCIRALVEGTNWRYASSELINQICLKVVGALEEEVGRTGTGTHLGLAISLVKRNPLVIEPYARSLIKSGLFFLTDGDNKTKSLSAEMIHSIMKWVDNRSISSEIRNIVDVLEKLADESLLGLSGVVLETLATAKTIDARRGVGLENRSSPVAGLILNPKLSNGCNHGSYQESNWETVSAKDECLFKSTSRRVNGFGYEGLGSREHYSMEAMKTLKASHTEDIVGSGSDGRRMVRCIMHDRCDRCMFKKSSDRSHQVHFFLDPLIWLFHYLLNLSCISPQMVFSC